MKSGSAITPTLVSKGCIVTGKIESKAFVRIDGAVNGDLFISEGLIVGEDGIIEGNIKTRELVVYGIVNGMVNAESVEIKSSGKIIGEVFTESLQVEKGANYSGNINMQKDSLKKETALVLN